MSTPVERKHNIFIAWWFKHTKITKIERLCMDLCSKDQYWRPSWKMVAIRVIQVANLFLRRKIHNFTPRSFRWDNRVLFNAEQHKTYKRESCYLAAILNFSQSTYFPKEFMEFIIGLSGHPCEGVGTQTCLLSKMSGLVIFLAHFTGLHRLIM